MIRSLIPSNANWFPCNALPWLAWLSNKLLNLGMTVSFNRCLSNAALSCLKCNAFTICWTSILPVFELSANSVFRLSAFCLTVFWITPIWLDTFCMLFNVVCCKSTTATFVETIDFSREESFLWVVSTDSRLIVLKSRNSPLRSAASSPRCLEPALTSLMRFRVVFVSRFSMLVEMESSWTRSVWKFKIN